MLRRDYLTEILDGLEKLGLEHIHVLDARQDELIHRIETCTI